MTFEEEGIGGYIWVDDSQTVYYQTSMKQEDEKEDKDKKEESSKKLPQKNVSTKVTYKMDGRGVLPEDRLYQIKKILLGHEEAEVVLEEDRGLSLQYVSKDESFILYYDRLNPEDEWVYGGSLYRYDLSIERKDKAPDLLQSPSNSIDNRSCCRNCI